MGGSHIVMITYSCVCDIMDGVYCCIMVRGGMRCESCMQ